MKNLVLLFITIFLIGFLDAHATFTDAQKSNLHVVNEWNNGGGEYGKTNWSETGSGTLSTDTSTKLRGKASIKFVSSGSGDYVSSSGVSCKQGPNCLVRFWYKTTSSNLTATIYDGSSNLIATLPLTSNTEFTKAELSFIATTPTTLYSLRITDGNAGADTIYIDEGYLGANDNIGSVDLNNTQYDLSSYITASPSISSLTNAIGYIYKTKDGSWRMAFNIAYVASSGATSHTITISGLTFKNAGRQSISAGSSTADLTTLFAGTNPNASTMTIDLSASNANIITSGDVALESKPSFVVDNASSQVVRLDTSTILWSGNFGSDCSWSNTNTSFSDPSADASCTFTQTLNKNIGTVTAYGSTLPGIVFTPSRVGVYEICATSAIETSTAGYSGAVQLYDGTNVYSSVGSRQQKSPFTLCGLVEATSLASISIRLRSIMESGGGSTTIDGSLGSNSLNWTIKYVSQSFPTPNIINSISTTYLGQVRTERAVLNCDSGSAITSQLGSWVSSIGNISSGICTVTLNSGIFNTTPICKCADQSSTLDSTTKGNATSTTSVSIIGTKPSDGTALTSFDCMLECYEGR
ncbi:MAG: hypothetical protein ACP5N7_01105 [Candidatus Pacearchaeota archaeon]